MAFYLVALRVQTLSFSMLADLAETVLAGFIKMALTYPDPPVLLLDMKNSLADFRKAISKWGDVHNRGSHTDYLNLLAKRDNMRKILALQARYAERKTPGNRQLLSSIGWDLKKPARRSVGVLQQVQNARQFTSRQIDSGTLRIDWDRPLDSQGVRINSYQVRRGLTSDFEQSEVIAMVTKCSFLDLNPGTGYHFYWIIPFNASGLGVKNDPVMAIATPIP